MKIRALHIATALVFALGSGAASAFTLSPGIGTVPGAQLEDDDIDFFIDNDGDGLLSVDDQLIAPFEITSINDILAANGSDPAQPMNLAVDELVGVSTITVASLTPAVGGGVTRIDFKGNSDGTPMLQYFQGGVNFDLEGDANPFTNCTSLATCLAAATDGTLWASFDIVDADDQWFFSPASGFEAIGDNPGAVAGIGATTKVGTVNFALSTVANNSGYTFEDLYIGCLSVPDGVYQCADDGLTSLLGSADILGGLGLPVNLGAFARSDADMALNVVPEPASLALLGMGLLGMGAMRRRKKA